MANEFKVRKGLIVQGSGSNIFDVQGSQGQLFSITDSLVGSLFSVNDISGIPIMEVFSDNTIKLGTFNQEAIIVSGSRTGMGIATPQAELHISGANNDSLFRIQSPASASIMSVSGSGLVGIGTATPTQKISVDTGNVGFTSGFGISWDSDTEWIKRAAASDQLQLATQNTVRLNIGSTQGQLVAIGLGATAASAQFQVRGGGATAATTAMRIEDSGGNARLTILDDGTSAFNTSHLYVSSSGRVGIGTTTPIAQLHVTNSMLINGTSDYFGGISTTIPIQMFAGVANNGIGFRTDNFYLYPYGSSTRVFWGWNGNSAWNLRNNNTSSFELYNNSPANTVMWTVSSSGDMGIGTTSPTARLHVGGASNAGLFKIDSPAVNNIIYVSGSGNVGIGIATPSAPLHVNGDIFIPFNNRIGGGTIYNSTWNRINLYNGGTGDMEITLFNTSWFLRHNANASFAGNVGIGETSPSARLEIRGSGATSATTALRVENSNTSASLVVTDDIRVGINKTTPNSELDVNGNTIITGSITSTSNITTLGSVVTPSQTISVGNGWGNSSGTINLLNIAGNLVPTATAIINSLAITSTVSQSVNPTTIIRGILVSPTFNTLGPQYRAFEWNNNQGFGLYGVGAAPNYLSGSLGIGTTSPSASLHISGASNSNLLRVGSPTNDNILFVSGSGNVGIGTTTPTNTLQVVGGITATSITASIISASSGITGSLLGTSSWAQSASNAINAQTASFLPVGTYQITSSWAVSASNSINARTSSNIFPAITNNTSSYVLTATGNGTINGNSNLTFDGSDLTLGSFTGIVLPSNGYVKGPQSTVLLGGNATYNVSTPNDFVTATASFGSPSSTRIQLLTNVESIPGGYDSGSIFFKTPSGSGMTYTNEGRLGIGVSNPTNTLQIQGNVSASSYTGSLFGTSSWAVNAQTASFLPVGTYQITSSRAISALTASFLPVGTYSITSSWATNALTASNITPSITNNTDNRVLTATGGGTINGESNLTFDGSVLTVTGRANISTSITSSTATVGFGLTSALNAGQTTIRGSGVDTVGALTIQNSGGTAAVFTVLNGGTTGVGENNPSARLHVKGSGATSATTALRVENSSAAARLTILDDGTSAFNTSHLYVSSSGRVAVGTTTPQRLFDVYNGANPGIAASFGAQMGNNNFSGISFGYVEQANALYRKSALVFERTETHGGGTNASGKIHFLLNNNSSTSATAITDAVLTIDSVGTTAGSSRVGIGTRFPTASLHISGTVATDNLMRVQSRTGAEYFFISASGNVGIGTNLPSADLHISGASADSLLRVGSPTQANTLFITGSNRVGIGTGTPSALFEVNDKIIAEAAGNVGIQTLPSDWIHLSSDPGGGKYLNIDAAQTSNSPPLTTMAPTDGYGITANKYYLAEPDYWMEIKLGGTIVLIPCYFPQ